MPKSSPNFTGAERVELYAALRARHNALLVLLCDPHDYHYAHKSLKGLRSLCRTLDMEEALDGQL